MIQNGFIIPDFEWNIDFDFLDDFLDDWNVEFEWNIDFNN